MIRRLLAPLFASLGLLVVLALPAVAHVTVSADNTSKGSFSVLTFKVPNEESDANTTGLKIQFPTEHPIPFVSVQPKVGWTAKVTKRTLDEPIKSEHGTISEVVAEVEWSGGKIEPGQFDMFNVSAGPLPTDAESLTFKTIQTYTNAAGETHEVAWIQESAEGQPEPEHPAPVLMLTAAGDGHSHDAASDEATDEHADAAPSTDDAAEQTDDGPTVTAAATEATSDDGSSTTALVIGVAGLVVAIAALIIALTRKPKGAAG